MTESKGTYTVLEEMNAAIHPSRAELEAMLAELVAPYDAGVRWCGVSYICDYCGAEQAWFTVGARFPHAEDCVVERGREMTK